MAATALMTVSCKVTGVESDESLANQVYEIVKRFNSTVAPADVQPGHIKYTDAWTAITPTGGAIAGVLLVAGDVTDMSVQVGITAEIDFTIPKGKSNFISAPSGLASDGLTIKVQHEGTSPGDDDYCDFIVFGAAS